MHNIKMLQLNRTPTPLYPPLLIKSAQQAKRNITASWFSHLDSTAENVGCRVLTCRNHAFTVLLHEIFSQNSIFENVNSLGSGEILGSGEDKMLQIIFILPF